jgi:hypothetical protein
MTKRLEEWQRAVIRAAFPGDEAQAQRVFEFVEGEPYCVHPTLRGRVGDEWLRCQLCGAQVYSP